jgi:hypothetical protein
MTRTLVLGAEVEVLASDLPDTDPSLPGRSHRVPGPVKSVAPVRCWNQPS